MKVIFVEKKDISKFISILIGLAIIFIFLASFLNSKSLLDLLFITIGVMGIVIGFYIQDGKINQTVTYFVALYSVNVFQWLIVIYILLFINQIQLYGDFLIILTIAPLTTISLIVQIRTSDLKYLGNRQMTNKDVILVDKMRGVLNDKVKVALIFTGFVIMLACLGSFIFSKSPLELFGGSIGLMVILWGFYRDGNNARTPEYTPGLAHNRYYRESKNIKVTVTYFLIMAGILIFQWFTMYYISFIYQFYVPYEVYKAEWACIPYTFVFSFLATFYFYVQIRESDLKYIGKKRNPKKRKENKGYLVCNKCKGYYKLQPDESPENFTGQCECGGKLVYHDNIKR
jgi:hypothetical protein